MQSTYFLDLESLPDGTSKPLDEVSSHLQFNEQGLIPVITQDAHSHSVLMMAWMNRASLSETLRLGQMVYWSRSRNRFWRKGESSGHVQTLVEMSFDCDGDAILCKVIQDGVACHTGRPNCFYLEVDREAESVRVRGDAQPV